jgi:MFS family permease
MSVKKWLPIIILALAQFVMVLDSTVMNVSLSTIVKDLNTTVETLQLAITLFTLTMAAFMLVGGKLGDIWGRKQAFLIGLVIYSVGSLTTALSPNVTVLIIGWSFVEALGAILVIPAIAALAAANYAGKDRATAFAAIGGAAGAAVAAGPLIGGLATTYLTWRIVFVGEVVINLFIIAFSRNITGAARPDKRPSLDVVGAILSAAGLFLIVLAVLKSSEWGWVAPKGALTIAGHEITPFGLSAVPFLILLGAVLLALFRLWIERREERGQEPLLTPGLLRLQPLRSGLAMLSILYLSVTGTFFVLPVYLQLTLQRNALQTGVVLLPLAAGVVVFSLGGGRLSSRVSPRRVVVGGLLLMLVGIAIVMWQISPTLKTVGFAVGLALFGSGIGLVLSQLGNVNLSSVREEQSSEVGGAQGVFQNVGASLGTALIGALLIAGLTSGFQSRILASTVIRPNVAQSIVSQTKAGVAVVSQPEAEQIARQAGLNEAEVQEVGAVYSEAQLLALKEAMLGVGILVVVGFWFTRKLPGKPLTEDRPSEEEAEVPATRVAASTP